MNIKRYAAAILAVGMVLGTASCGSDSSKTDSNKSSSKAEDFSATENVKVSDAESIEAIPEGSEKEILYLGETDINPTKSAPEKSTELKLFESKGGKVKFIQTNNEDRFDNLAAAVMAEKNSPDIFKYEWLAFPHQAVKGLYQPIDDIVDFSNDMWSDAKKTADQFVLEGKHYVAPLGYQASAMLCYDKDLINAEGLEDPYELYENGEWTWDAWEDIMSDFVKKAPSDTERYGVNGYFSIHIIQQTGKTFVSYDSDKNEFVSNLNDPDITNGQNFLYDLKKKGLILDGWIGSARECFQQNCLFYAMGNWAYSDSNSPKKNEQWGVVPIPAYDKNPQKITTSDMLAYMWVKGSTKNDAIKCWFECCRAAYTDPEYTQANKDRFMENNPNWTDEMYGVKTDVVSDDYLMIFDSAFGVSSNMGDKKTFDGNQCLVDALYGASTALDEDGNQQTWTQVREKYTGTVDTELKELNKKLKSLS